MPEEKKIGRPRRADGKNRVNVWQSEHYERISINVRKGERDRIRAQARKNSQTISGFINGLIAAAVPGFQPLDSDNAAAPEASREYWERVKPTKADQQAGTEGQTETE